MLPTRNTQKVKQITVIGYWPDYEESFFKEASTEEFTINIVNMSARKSKILPRFLRNFVHKKIFLTSLKEANKRCDVIFIQDNRLILEVIMNSSYRFTGGIIMRNIVNNEKKISLVIKQLHTQSYNFWSFDESDCATYNFRFYNQFISKIINEDKNKEKQDFLFIGADKGRKEQLDNIKEILTTCGFTSLIEIKTTKKHIPYDTYVRFIKESKCLIDLVQKNQQGLTLRPLEANFYQKKLLTNNINILQSSLYNAENVYLIDDKIDPNKLKDFMSKPFVNLEKENLKKFTTGSVLQKMAKQAVSLN